MTESASEIPKERLLEPSDAEVDNPPLTEYQIQQWRNEGFTLVDGLVPDDLVDQLLTDAVEIFPKVGSDEATVIRDFGEGMTFPSQSEYFNDLTLHPRILEASSQLLNAPITALRLTQSDLWPKYSSANNQDAFDNQDQRMHMDYPNHTLTHPSPWEEPEAVEIILYLANQTEVGGSTAIVPRVGLDDEAYKPPLIHSPGIGDIPWINDRLQAEEWFHRNKPEVAELRGRLYRREKYTRYRKGSVLFYRQDVWHRGTPLSKNKVRFAQNLTFRMAEASWISTLHPGWSWAMYKPDQQMERLLATLSPEQRSVLGFPPPGDSYWDHQKIDAVEARYGAFGFDATPYREQLTWTGLH